MARSPAPPGPPPRHYQPPGPAPYSPAWTGPLPLASPNPAGQPSSSGASAGAVVAVAMVTLLLGLAIGFFVGRAVERDDQGVAAPPLTSPSTSTSRPTGDTIPQTTAPAAPPATDLEPSTIGSIEDPVPVGQSYILGLYEVEVRGVVRDAGDLLQDHDPSNPAAPAGSQHLLVEVGVRFTDEFGLGNPAAIPFLVSDGTGRWNDFDARCGTVPQSLLEAGPLERGDEAVGNVCFTVPSDVVPQLRFGTEGFDGPVYFALPE